MALYLAVYLAVYSETLPRWYGLVSCRVSCLWRVERGKRVAETLPRWYGLVSWMCSALHGCVQHSMDVFSTPWGLSVLCGVSVRWLAAVPLGAPGSWRGGQQESPPPHTYLGTLVRLYD